MKNYGFPSFMCTTVLCNISLINEKLWFGLFYVCNNLYFHCIPNGLWTKLDLAMDDCCLNFVLMDFSGSRRYVELYSLRADFTALFLPFRFCSFKIHVVFLL
jgi:hypothetical protein